MNEFKEIFYALHFTSLLWCLLIPLAFMALDILTGLVGAWARKDFQSAIMRSGLAKKCGEITVIIIGMMVIYGMTLPEYILTCVCIYIAFMEFMSILENLKKLNVPIPGFVSSVLNNVDESLKSDDYATLMKKFKELQKEVETVAVQVGDDGK